MAFHHLAIATRDLDATHRFYTEAMGFELAHVDVIPFQADGWARHLFYDTGNGEMLAIWDLHLDGMPDFDPALSTGLGLPNYVNHVAFAAASLQDIEARKDRWLANGLDVVRIDHGWCVSIYADDPNGTVVEFCCTTRVFDSGDRDRAQDLLSAAAPDVDRTPAPTDFFIAAEHAAATPA